MPKVLVYSSDYCGYCIRAKHLLERKGICYEELRVDRDPALRQDMERKSQRRSVPQIFIGDYSVGGFDELWNLAQSGQLDTLLADTTQQENN